LAQVYRRQGRFEEAVNVLKRGHELGSRKVGWPYPSAQWLRETEHLLALDRNLAAIQRGAARPGSAAERIELAKLCHEYKKWYAAAARFCAGAFAAEPKLIDDLRTHNRYNAACSAALAGCGQGDDAANLDEKERARLRQQAIEWLRADLAAWTQMLDKEPEKARASVHQTLQHWQQDADFAGVRGDGLAKLPEAERNPWQQLWADVEQTLKKSNHKDAKEKEE
jgi:hypothetical protein